VPSAISCSGFGGAASSQELPTWTLAGLGRCALAAGHTTQAQALLRRALEIFQKIGAPEADDVSRELAAHAQAAPA
jgi:Tfp pilus assembly protein PilF